MAWVTQHASEMRAVCSRCAATTVPWLESDGATATVVETFILANTSTWAVHGTACDAGDGRVSLCLGDTPARVVNTGLAQAVRTWCAAWTGVTSERHVAMALAIVVGALEQASDGGAGTPITVMRNWTLTAVVGVRDGDLRLPQVELVWATTRRIRGPRQGNEAAHAATTCSVPGTPVRAKLREGRDTLREAEVCVPLQESGTENSRGDVNAPSCRLTQDASNSALAYKEPAVHDERPPCSRAHARNVHTGWQDTVAAHQEKWASDCGCETPAVRRSTRVAYALGTDAWDVEGEQARTTWGAWSQRVRCNRCGVRGWLGRMIGWFSAAQHGLHATGKLASRNCFPEERHIAAPVWSAMVYWDERPSSSTGGPLDHPRAPPLQRQQPRTFRASTWAEVFREHPHRGFLVNGAKFGFPMMVDDVVLRGTVGTRTSVKHTVLKENELRQVQAWVLGQRAAGNVSAVTVWPRDVTGREPASDLGSSSAPRQPFVLSPMVVAEKAGARTAEGWPKVRPCHHLSWCGPVTDASGNQSTWAVNDWVGFDELEPLFLLSVAHVIRRLRFLRIVGPTKPVDGFRCDMRAWYRQLGVRKRDRWCLGFEWEGEWLVHTVQPFGARGAAHCAAMVTNAVCDIINSGRGGVRRPQGQSAWVHGYIDDMVAVGYREDLGDTVVALRECLQRLGVEEADDKFVAPTSVLTVLGVELDISKGMVRVTESRRARLVEAITSMLQATDSGMSVKVVDLQRVVGKLHFILPAVTLGRVRLFPLWRALAAVGVGTRAVERNATTMWLESEAVRALQWWLQRLLADAHTVTGLGSGCGSEPRTVAQRSTTITQRGRQKVGGVGPKATGSVWDSIDAIVDVVASATTVDAISGGEEDAWEMLQRMYVGVDRSVSIWIGVATDAADYGYGGVVEYEQTYVVGKWSPMEQAWSINVREMWAVVLLVAACGHALTGRCVVFQCDNYPTVCGVNNGGSNCVRLRFLVSLLTSLQEKLRFRMVMSHITTSKNSVCDRLSRGEAPSSCLRRGLPTPVLLERDNPIAMTSLRLDTESGVSGSGKRPGLLHVVKHHPAEVIRSSECEEGQTWQADWYESRTPPSVRSRGMHALAQL
jgi:hypothetical protein